jgi:hypothetical protein
MLQHKQGPVPLPTERPGPDRFERQERNSNKLISFQAQDNFPVLTAIPVGPRHWRVKTLAAGQVELFGLFDNRLQALGAAVLLAARVHGRVVP